jgi:hypothetical protein
MKHAPPYVCLNKLIFAHLHVLLQLSIAEDYEEMIGIFNARGHEAYGADLSRLGWITGLIPSAFSADYWKGTLQPSKTLGVSRLAI